MTFFKDLRDVLKDEVLLISTHYFKVIKFEIQPFSLLDLSLFDFLHDLCNICFLMI